MEITKVQALTKQKYQVEIDGQSAFVLYKGELSRYSIKEGGEITPQIYEEIVGQVLTKRAKLRAMHLLESVDRTKSQLTRKLQQNGYPEEVIEAAIAYVESYGYLDDKRYASHYVELKKESQGRARLKMELAKRGVGRQIIDEILDESQLGDSRESIRVLVEKKRRSTGPMDNKEKQRIYGFLMRKGYSSSDIMSVLRESEEL